MRIPAPSDVYNEAIATGDGGTARLLDMALALAGTPATLTFALKLNHILATVSDGCTGDGSSASASLHDRVAAMVVGDERLSNKWREHRDGILSFAPFKWAKRFPLGFGPVLLQPMSHRCKIGECTGVVKRHERADSIVPIREYLGLAPDPDPASSSPRRSLAELDLDLHGFVRAMFMINFDVASSVVGFDSNWKSRQNVLNRLGAPHREMFALMGFGSYDERRRFTLMVKDLPLPSNVFDDEWTCHNDRSSRSSVWKINGFFEDAVVAMTNPAKYPKQKLLGGMTRKDVKLVRASYMPVQDLEFAVEFTERLAEAWSVHWPAVTRTLCVDPMPVPPIPTKFPRIYCDRDVRFGRLASALRELYRAKAPAAAQAAAKRARLNPVTVSVKSPFRFSSAADSDAFDVPAFTILAQNNTVAIDSCGARHFIDTKGYVYHVQTGPCAPRALDGNLVRFLLEWERCANDDTVMSFLDVIGKYVGYCIFCSRQLSRDASVSAGYGEVCGSRFRSAIAAAGVVDPMVKRVDRDDALESLHAAAPSVQRTVEWVLRNLDSDGAGVVATLLEVESDPDAALRWLVDLVGGDATPDNVRETCMDVYVMRSSRWIPMDQGRICRAIRLCRHLTDADGKIVDAVRRCVGG